MPLWSIVLKNSDDINMISRLPIQFSQIVIRGQEFLSVGKAMRYESEVACPQGCSSYRNITRGTLSRNIDRVESTEQSGMQLRVARCEQEIIGGQPHGVLYEAKSAN